MMNWQQLMSPTRFQIDEHGTISAVPPKAHTPYRTPFHTDYDRVVFSNAFRRLGRKTQVHPLAKNDHTHNRLTHSVEVASVGRSLGNLVGELLRAEHQLPPNLSPNDLATTVQTACLAHDIGNPPFGHTGEDALRDWFRQPENVIQMVCGCDARFGGENAFFGGNGVFRLSQCALPHQPA